MNVYVLLINGEVYGVFSSLPDAVDHVPEGYAPSGASTPEYLQYTPTGEVRQWVDDPEIIEFTLDKPWPNYRNREQEVKEFDN